MARMVWLRCAVYGNALVTLFSIVVLEEARPRRQSLAWKGKRALYRQVSFAHEGDLPGRSTDWKAQPSARASGIW
eukprot:6211081-Pleurochrysis_carterae.AAC.3